MKYRIIISREAEKTLFRLSPQDFLAVSKAIDSLEEDPWLVKAKKLAGTNLHRIRVRNYRVIYFIDKESGIVYVERIARRSEDTYKGL